MITARALPLAILAGLIGALMLMSVAVDRTGVGGLILRSMTSLPLFAVGLSQGLIAAVIAGMVGTGVSWSLGPDWGIAFAVGSALPALVIVALALKPPAPPSTGWMVSGLALLGVAGFVALDLACRAMPGGLEGTLTNLLTEAFREVAEQVPELDMSEVGPPGPIAHWVAGAVLLTWMLVIAINGVLAQGALTRFQLSRVGSPDLAELSVPRVTGVAFVAAVAAASFGTGEVGFIGTNLALVLTFPLAFGGLGVVHALVARHPARQALLTMFYIVVLGLGLPIVLIVALGLIEQGAGLRRQIAAMPRRGDE